MKQFIKCDCCGKLEDTYSDNTYGILNVYRFDDGYNTDRYNSKLYICSDCLFERFTKEEFINGREF